MALSSNGVVSIGKKEDLMEKKPLIRLVVSDLDGTLLDKKGRLPSFVHSAIQSLQQKGGIGFTFISGRPPLPFLRGIIKELELTMPFGAANGGGDI